jgi:hypothetical protein
MSTSKKTPKRTAPAMASTTTAGEEKERLSIFLRASVAKRLRHLAVDRGDGYSEVAEQLIVEGLERHGA